MSTFYFFYQFSSVTQLCPTLCDPMDCSRPDFPVHHQLLELTQTHVHWVGDAIQPSHPLLSPSPPAFNLSQNQGLFQRVSSSDQVDKILELQLSASVLPMNIQSWFPLELTGMSFLLSKRLSRILFSTRVPKHQFFGTQPSLWSNSHIRTWLLEKPQLWLVEPLLVMSLLFNMLSKLVITFLPRSKLFRREKAFLHRCHQLMIQSELCPILS